MVAPFRLRRIVAFPLSLLAIGFGMVTLAAGTVAGVLAWMSHPAASPLAALGGVAVAGAAVLAYAAYKRWVERAPLRELSIVAAPAEVGAGTAFGAALFSAVAGAVAALGGLEIVGVRGAGDLWAMLGMAVYSGVLEEVLFRGLMLRLLERLVGTWLALATTAAFFGGAHLFNPNATWLSALAIALEGGIMLGAAYLLTRRLWLAIGIHAGWNFAQGWLFSIPVSGMRPPLGLLVTKSHGPRWLTGGAFGLEASLVAVVIATLAGLALSRAAARGGVIVAPRWRRGDAVGKCGLSARRGMQGAGPRCDKVSSQTPDGA